MSTPTTSTIQPVDFEKLLQPISDARPSGESLRSDGTYDRINEARREDDASLSRGIYQIELKKADWAAVEEMCLEALETRSKDLLVGAWLLDAWMHLYGFAGVGDGLKLLTALCENFWDTLYPEMNGDDIEGRLAPVVWLNEKLSLRLKLIPVTAPQANDVFPYSYADWESAAHLEQIAVRNPKAVQAAEASGKPTTTKFHASVMMSPREFYADLFDDLHVAIDACMTLEKLLDEKCGKQSPSFHLFKENLGTILHLVTEVLRARQEDPYQEGAGVEMPADSEEEEDGANSGQWSSSPIRSRAEAYRRLSEAADYLLRTEPHSPTPYLVKRAVAWGSMSLFEVLQQIIRNDTEMQEVNKLLRLANPDGQG